MIYLFTLRALRNSGHTTNATLSFEPTKLVIFRHSGKTIPQTARSGA